MTGPQTLPHRSELPFDTSPQTVTLVEATTFCASDPRGDIAGAAAGLYYRDTRLLSRWELLVDGHPAEQLALDMPEPDEARFVLRVPPRAGLADSTLLVERRRLVGEGLAETITVRNLGHEDTAVALVLYADADFAGLLEVKQGRAHQLPVEATPAEHELLLHDQSGTGHGVAVRAAGAAPMIVPGQLRWQAVVPAHGEWETRLLVQPISGHRRVEVTCVDRCAEHAARHWRATPTALTASAPALDLVLRRADTDLGALRIDDSAAGAGYVAAGAPWFMTLFGRDSLLTSWMTLPLDHGLALSTLRELAATQGARVDAFTEEQPGRIMHELRHGGRDWRDALTYGSVDSTPLFVVLLAEARRWGAPDEEVAALLPAADAALRWIAEYGDRDGDGFVEYRRLSDQGPVNQGWKGSFDAVTDARGRTAGPSIALAEVQGYVYAAYLARAELAAAFGDPRTGTAMLAAAEELRARFDEAFWIPKHGWYALGLDGDKQQIDALTSNAAQCLWTGIVADERAEELIDRLAGPGMNSGFGLRTLADGMGAYNPMSYHNGSIWPHDTALAVAGLARYRHVSGAAELAESLAAGLLDAAERFGGRLPELFCGFPRERFDPPIPYPAACAPQALASAAPLLLIRALLGLEPDLPRRTLLLTPRLPAAWGEVRLTDLRLGGASVHVIARGDTARVEGLPAGWHLDIR
ncbi:glycogen debranching N-terminal domain-containing protein [Nocardia sp. NPDC050697]|uniref:amylo-alpha-1,6-glucosidase n=1 Tax=Nocardia sp. NPDC050697 TaxID=3155158 RepID=UPI003409D5E8